MSLILCQKYTIEDGHGHWVDLKLPFRTVSTSLTVSPKSALYPPAYLPDVAATQVAVATPEEWADILCDLQATGKYRAVTDNGRIAFITISPRTVYDLEVVYE